MSYTKGTIKGSHIDMDELAFAMDTAGSWGGAFPPPAAGDYLVTIGDKDGNDGDVLVSRRYVGAQDHDDAAALALSAFAERHDYETDNEGKLVEIEIEEAGPGLYAPCWVESVNAVVGSGFKEITATLPLHKGKSVIDFCVQLDVDTGDAIDVYCYESDYENLPAKLKHLNWRQRSNDLYVHADDPEEAWSYLEDHAIYNLDE